MNERLKLWLFEGLREPEGPHVNPAHVHQSPWWKVMCLTGVDYFSTLGYQPGIAFLAAGTLSPLATLVLVLLTVFGALPMYHRIAALSPHGQGSIQVLEELLPRWRGKAMVLCLLGFAATGFIITITLSAADASAHVVENPLVPRSMNHPVIMTLVLLTGLGAVFLKGFREAVGLAVPIVAVYIGLNVVLVGWGMQHVLRQPHAFSDWGALLTTQHGSWVHMIVFAMLLFPKLALGLSGFETGVAVMPLVKGDPGDTEEQPIGRIRNTRKLLTVAALIMSVLLVGSSIMTTLMIPPELFNEGGQAYGRALAYLAHEYLGNIFGTVYDLSTVAILWFAGASAMVGLLNLVPRYLPRYGMAPEWARTNRPLVLIFIAITFLVTILFKADVTAQGGAYATGVLVLMGSAALAVTLAARRDHKSWFGYLLLTAIFGYTTVINIYERPEGLKISAIFIITIIMTSMVSRVLRSTELRVQGIKADDAACAFIKEAGGAPVRIIANRPDVGDAAEYEHKLREARESHHLPPDERVLFVEVRPGDVSEFSDTLVVEGADVSGHHVLRCVSPAIPNAIAALLLYCRDETGKIPHAYFGWTEGNPIAYLLKFLAFGEGDTAPVTREVLRQAEPDPMRRPRIHVG
ncbi:MAG: amino acid transporter [Vicinamibacterales bacterium]